MIYINIPVKVHVKSVYFLTQGPNLQSADNDFTINFNYVSCIFTIHFCVPCVVHSTTTKKQRKNSFEVHITITKKQKQNTRFEVRPTYYSSKKHDKDRNNTKREQF